MTKREVFNGKPYAGNPHLRFDERKVASVATTRRGSLLYTTKKSIIATLAAGSAALAFADAATPPSVSEVEMAQAANRLVTISYTLADGPAVVTLDVQTNATVDAAADDPGWISIGGEAVWNAAGDVWKKVTGDGKHTITWRPDKSWPDHRITGNGARAVVTAWALDNTPQYMVVDLETANTVRYYPAVEFLPCSKFGQTGAVTNNPAYKTSQLVMRKIEACGIEWTMGSTTVETQREAAREDTHKVTLAADYYIGVFEMTKAQWNIVTNSSDAASTEDMRPANQVCYNEIRLKNTNASASSTEIANYSWPKDPNPSSFLGLLNAKTGVAFDLPSEAQWEFACRAGHYSGFWNDGSAVLNKDADDNLKRLGCFKSNRVDSSPSIVGSYAPSDWGLYDMHGNVREWCLDWGVDDITGIDGNVNIDPSSPASPLTGSTTKRILRGGSHPDDAKNCRSARRYPETPTLRSAGDNYGFRVVCPVGISD